MGRQMQGSPGRYIGHGSIVTRNGERSLYIDRAGHDSTGEVIESRLYRPGNLTSYSASFLDGDRVEFCIVRYSLHKSRIEYIRTAGGARIPEPGTEPGASNGAQSSQGGAASDPASTTDTQGADPSTGQGAGDPGSSGPQNGAAGEPGALPPHAFNPIAPQADPEETVVEFTGTLGGAPHWYIDTDSDAVHIAGPRQSLAARGYRCQPPEHSVIDAAVDAATVLPGDRVTLRVARGLAAVAVWRAISIRPAGEPAAQDPEPEPEPEPTPVADPPARPTDPLSRLLEYLTARDATGHTLNVMMVGPAGCGKSTMAKLAADRLGLPFYADSYNLGTTVRTVIGYREPTTDGDFTYVPSSFVTAYESGGLYLADEFDAADANVLCVLHMALANGSMIVEPRADARIAERHPDFHMIAAANTYGSGSRVYVGREELDEATLSRFVPLTVDYDSEYESSILKGSPHRKELTKFRDSIRRVINDSHLRRTWSTRHMTQWLALLNAGIPMAEIASEYFAAWSANDRQTAASKAVPFAAASR